MNEWSKGATLSIAPTHKTNDNYFAQTSEGVAQPTYDR